MLFSQVLESVLFASTVAAQTSQVLPPTDVVLQRSAAELIAEAVVPPDGMVLARGAVPIGSDLRAMIAAGRMEIRLRVEYHEFASLMVITTYLATPGDQLPAEKGPSESSGLVMQMLEVKTDFVRGEILQGGSLALAGTLSQERVPWLGARLTVGTPVTAQLQLDTESTNRVEHLTVSWPGGAATAASGLFTSMSPLTRGPQESGACIQRSSLCSPHPRRY